VKEMFCLFFVSAATTEVILLSIKEKINKWNEEDRKNLLVSTLSR
jgi:hypothetical protein